jgi:hypothetical protein
MLHYAQRSGPQQFFACGVPVICAFTHAATL